jgi:hypothetical protein
VFSIKGGGAPALRIHEKTRHTELLGNGSNANQSSARRVAPRPFPGRLWSTASRARTMAGMREGKRFAISVGRASVKPSAAARVKNPRIGVGWRSLRSTRTNVREIPLILMLARRLAKEGV